MNKDEEAIKVPQAGCDRLTDPSEIAALGKYLRKKKDALQDSINLGGNPTKTATSELKNNFSGLGTSVTRLNTGEINSLERIAATRIIGKPGDVDSLGNQRVEAEGIQNNNNKLSGNLETLEGSIEPELKNDDRERLQGERKDVTLAESLEKLLAEDIMDGLGNGTVQKLQADKEDENTLSEKLLGLKVRGTVKDLEDNVERIKKNQDDPELSARLEKTGVKRQNTSLSDELTEIMGKTSEVELNRDGEKVIHKMWGTEIADPTVKGLEGEVEKVQDKDHHDIPLETDLKRLNVKDKVNLSEDLQKLGGETEGVKELETRRENLETKDIEKLEPKVEGPKDIREPELVKKATEIEGVEEIKELTPTLETLEVKETPKLGNDSVGVAGKVVEIDLSDRREEIDGTKRLDTLDPNLEKLKDNREELLYLNPVLVTPKGGQKEIGRLETEVPSLNTKPLEELRNDNALEVLGSKKESIELGLTPEKVVGDKKDTELGGNAESVIGVSKESPDITTTVEVVPDADSEGLELGKNAEKVESAEGGIQTISKLEGRATEVGGNQKEVEVGSPLERVPGGEGVQSLRELPINPAEKVTDFKDPINSLGDEAEKVTDWNDPVNGLSTERENLEIGEDPILSDHREDLADIQNPELGNYRENLEGIVEPELSTQRENLGDIQEVGLGNNVEKVPEVGDDPALSDHRENLKDDRDTALSDHKETLTDDRDAALNDHREDLEHIEEYDLSNYRENLEDNRETALSDHREDLADDRDTALSDFLDELDGIEDHDLSDHREDLADDRDTALSDFLDELDGIEDHDLSDHREDLADDRDTALSDFRDDLTDNRETALSDHRENLKDNRETELSDHREDLEDDGIDALSDFLDSLEDERETTLSSTILKRKKNDTDKINEGRVSDYENDKYAARGVYTGTHWEKDGSDDYNHEDFSGLGTERVGVQLEDEKVNIRETLIEGSRGGDGPIHKGWDKTLDERSFDLDDKNEETFNPDEDGLYEGALNPEDKNENSLPDDLVGDLIEILKSRGNLQQYYVNILNFAQRKDLSGNWGQKVAALMSTYLSSDNASEKRLKEFEKQLFKSVFTEYNTVQKRGKGVEDTTAEILEKKGLKGLGLTPKRVSGEREEIKNLENSSENINPNDIDKTRGGGHGNYSGTAWSSDNEEGLTGLGTIIAPTVKDDTTKLQAGRNLSSSSDDYRKSSWDGTIESLEGEKYHTRVKDLKNDSLYVSKYKLEMNWLSVLDMSQYLRWVAEKATFGSHGSLRAMLLDTTLMTLVATRNVAERLAGANRDRLPGGNNVVGAVTAMTQGNLVEAGKAAARKVAKAGIGALTGDSNQLINKTYPLNRPKGRWEETYGFQLGNNRNPTTGDPPSGKKNILKSIGKAIAGEVKGLVGISGDQDEYLFNTNYGNSSAIATTLTELCGARDVSSVEELRTAIEGSPIMTSASKVTTTRYNDSEGKVTTLDDNSNWEIILYPFIGKANGNVSYLPTIKEINAINSAQFNLTTAYGMWIPITSFELSKSKMVSKTLQLYNGEISYPVGMEYTNDLRLTIADDQYKSWRRYFELCADCAVYNSTLHDASYYKEAGIENEILNLENIEEKLKGDSIITNVDKTFICPAPYKNITFRCIIYCMTPQKETINKYDLLVVMKDFSEERSGEIEGGGSDLNVSFSIVGECPSEKGEITSEKANYVGNNNKRIVINKSEKAKDKAALAMSIAQVAAQHAVDGALDMF